MRRVGRRRPYQNAFDVARGQFDPVETVQRAERQSGEQPEEDGSEIPPAAPVGRDGRARSKERGTHRAVTVNRS